MNNTQKQKDIQLILKDIYSADPSLREHEAELIKLIQELIASKPNLIIDQEFRVKLKKEIMLLANEIKNNSINDKQAMKWGLPLMNQFLRPAGFVVLGAVAMGLIALPFFLSNNQGEMSLKSPFEFQVTRASNNAFGKLSANNAGDNAQSTTLESNGAVGETAPQVAPSALGAGGGYGSAVKTDSSIASTPESMMIRLVNYKYIYNGDLPELPESLEVFKRVKNSSVASSLATYLAKVNLGGFDLTKFKNTQLSNFTILEDKTDGYYISVDLTNGSISVSRNWYYAAEYSSNPLTKADIPGNDKIIAIADKFLKDYGVDLSNYGPGEVDDSWQDSMAKFESQKMFYIPESFSVIYPLVINNQEVYEQYGGKTGLYVSVNIRNMKVDSMWNLNTQQYQSSLYETVQDKDKILNAIGNNNRLPVVDGKTQIETIEFTLGEPILVLARVMNYNENSYDEFFCPALSFPVLSSSEDVGYYYQRNIVVPVIKEILDSQLNQNSSNVYPMPLQESVEVSQ